MASVRELLLNSGTSAPKRLLIGWKTSSGRLLHNALSLRLSLEHSSAASWAAWNRDRVWRPHPENHNMASFSDCWGQNEFKWRSTFELPSTCIRTSTARNRPPVGWADARCWEAGGLGMGTTPAPSLARCNEGSATALWRHAAMQHPASAVTYRGQRTVEPTGAVGQRDQDQGVTELDSGERSSNQPTKRDGQWKWGAFTDVATPN